MYVLGVLPAECPQWLRRQLRAIAESTRKGQPYVVLDTLYAAPAKVVEGLIVLADGATWNPGSGAGVYCYRSGVWNFLG